MPSAKTLLAWYDRHRRVLPWRRAPADPYRIWLSEIMLQQTTAAAVAPRYERFLARFPDVETLARASEAEVLEEWAGLGYYARARNLHAVSRRLAADGYPSTEAGWRALPGVGAYTAAAVAAIAFDRPTLPVDGNVERVAARVFAVEAPLPAVRPHLARLARSLLEDDAARTRPGDFAQALFDLGATICTPRKPVCAICPWRDRCRGLASGLADALPRRAAKPVRAARYGVHFRLTDAAGNVLLRRRPAQGLLGGMLELPGTPWRDTPWTIDQALPYAPVPEVVWRERDGVARHVFTHLTLEMRVLAATLPTLVPPPGCESRALAEAPRALPTAMRKLLLPGV